MPGFSVAARGYERGAVDELMRRIEGTLGRVPLDGPAISSEDVRKARFRVVLRGYERRSVDETLLDRIRELEAVERGPTYRPRHSDLPGPPPGSQWLVDWIHKTEFRKIRTRPGYSVNDVDDYLDRVMAGLLGEAVPVSARDVRECRFRTVRLRAAYDERDVDRFLESLAAALDGWDAR